MSGSSELIVLRLALIAVLFAFLLGAALVMRSGLSTGRPAEAGRRPAVANVRARLVVVGPAYSGLKVGAEFPLAGPVALGRDDVNGIVLADPSVSGRHASIEPAARGWLVRDLGSMNGTFVDGRRVDGRGLALADGAELLIGALSLRFRA